MLDITENYDVEKTHKYNDKFSKTIQNNVMIFFLNYINIIQIFI